MSAKGGEGEEEFVHAISRSWKNNVYSIHFFYYLSGCAIIHNVFIYHIHKKQFIIYKIFL